MDYLVKIKPAQLPLNGQNETSANTIVVKQEVGAAPAEVPAAPPLHRRATIRHQVCGTESIPRIDADYWAACDLPFFARFVRTGECESTRSAITVDRDEAPET